MLTSRVTIDEVQGNETKRELKKNKDSPYLQMNMINEDSSKPQITLHKEIIEDNFSVNNQSPTKFTFCSRDRTKPAYLEYGLHKNYEIDSSDSPKVLHEFLPTKYKDDEDYKIKLFKYLRKSENSNNKTDSCSLARYLKFTETYDGNLTKFENFSNVPFYKKKKKSLSCMKIYKTEQFFYDGKGKKNFFNFFVDKDIGFTSKWQQQIHLTEMDDDVNTDDEQLKYAERHCMLELAEGVHDFSRHKRCCRNYRIYHS